MQIKTYLHRYWVSPITMHTLFSDLSKEHMCPVIHFVLVVYTPYQLNVFCINYANEGYLHRSRVSFRLESVIITRHTHAHLKIAKKNTAVMIHFFFLENLLSYALMFNLCKLCIYLHNNKLILWWSVFPLPTKKVCTKIDINLDWILFINNVFYFCINYAN